LSRCRAGRRSAGRWSGWAWSGRGDAAVRGGSTAGGSATDGWSWQLDVMGGGGVLLAGGTEVKALTAIDDHSGFCLAVGLARHLLRADCLT
jgi:hypothetical protein